MSRAGRRPYVCVGCLEDSTVVFPCYDRQLFSFPQWPVFCSAHVRSLVSLSYGLWACGTAVLTCVCGKKILPVVLSHSMMVRTYCANKLMNCWWPVSLLFVGGGVGGVASFLFVLALSMSLV